MSLDYSDRLTDDNQKKVKTKKIDKPNAKRKKL